MVEDHNRGSKRGGHHSEAEESGRHLYGEQLHSKADSITRIQILRTRSVSGPRREVGPPSWRSGTTIFLLAILLVTLAVALIIIWYVNRRSNGFALVSKNHYYWSYGPTAVLVLLVAVWRQLDYHFKALMPWIILQNGAARAEDSLLLDYVSPIQATSLWRSIRNRHFSISMTILGFVLLKLITLVSTGLLVEETSETSGEKSLVTRKSRFDGSLYNATKYVLTTDAALAYTAYGILANGLDKPFGVAGNMVFETVYLPNSARSTAGRTTVQVNALKPEFRCEPAEVSINPAPYDSDNTEVNNVMVMIYPQCVPFKLSQSAFVLDAASEACPPRQFRGVIQRVNCSTDGGKDPFPNRQLLTLAEVMYSQTVNNSNNNAATASLDANVDFSSFSVGIKRSRSLLCTPAYSVSTVNLTIDTSRNQLQYFTAGEISRNESLPGFHNEDLASMFTGALADASNMFGDFDNKTVEEFPNTMFKMMASYSGGNYESLLEDDNMEVAAEVAFEHLAVQIIHKKLRQSANDPLQASFTQSQTRLVVSLLPLWTMVAGFCLVAGLTTILSCLQRRQTLWIDQSTPYTISRILALSCDLQHLLASVGNPSEAETTRTLDRHHFFLTECDSVDGSPEYSVQIAKRTSTKSQLALTTDEGQDGANIMWWKPLVVRPAFIVAILILPLAMIATLEILQRRSDNKGGIMTIMKNADAEASLFARFIPALVMLLLSTSFNAVDFNISVLAPYNNMRRRSVPANVSIKSSLIDKFPTIRLWNAARHRQFAALFSSVAALLGSVLTIVVSGLYTIETITRPSQTSLEGIDLFDTTWLGSATNDSSAAVLTSLTESTNISYPRFTHKELALPGIRLPSDQYNTSNDATDRHLRVSYPVLRASLDCQVMGQDSFNVTSGYNSRIASSSADVVARLPLPETCPFGGAGGNLTHLEISSHFSFENNQSYIGKLLDLHVGPYDPVQGSAFGEGDPSAQNDNPPGCPSLAFVYGYVDVADPRQTSVTTVMCYQQLQHVQATVTYNLVNLPNLELDQTNPPLVDEATIRLLPSSPSGDTAFSYRIQQHMDHSLSLFNQTTFASANLAQSPVDNFFQGVLFGQTPLPLTTLAGTGNQPTMLHGINAFYRRYMAQAISNNMRRATDEVTSLTGSEQQNNTQTTTYAATVLNGIQTRRLVQHRTSKLVLQVLLGTMSVLGTLAWKLTRLTDLVPYNPCTIFGVMYLFRESRMCGTGHDAGDWLELSGRSVMGGDDALKYRLGWWDGNGGVVENESLVDGQNLSGTEAEGIRRRKRWYGIDYIESVE